MSLFILDTDTLSLLERGHVKVSERVLSQSPGEIAISVISVEEQLSGWYTLLRSVTSPQRLAHAYQRLAETVRFLGGFQIVPLSEVAIAEFEQLKRQKLCVRGMDLKIAAIAMTSNATVVTRNIRDFGCVPGLAVADWSR